MILCSLEQLPEPKDQALRLWLARAEAETLRRVILAMEQKFECDGIKEVMESKDYPDKMAAANASFSRAMRYHTFLQVLDEIMAHPERFQTAKLL